MNEPEYILVHTVARRGETTFNMIESWHRERGFRSFGYQYYIRKDGTLITGRRETEQGAHAVNMGMNRKSIGVVFEGHGNYEKWTDYQWSTFRTLFQFMSLKYQIPVNRVLGHRETGAQKDCPGTLIDMDEVRSALRIPEPFSLSESSLV